MALSKPLELVSSFQQFLAVSGFVCSNVDPSMFVFRTSSHTLILLLYMDHIILTGWAFLPLSFNPLLLFFLRRLL